MLQIRKKLSAGILAVIVTMVLAITVGTVPAQFAYADDGAVANDHSFDYHLPDDEEWDVGDQTGISMHGMVTVDGNKFYDYTVNSVTVKEQSDDGVMNINPTEHGWHLQTGKVGSATVEVGYTNPDDLIAEYEVPQYDVHDFTITVVEDDNSSSLYSLDYHQMYDENWGVGWTTGISYTNLLTVKGPDGTSNYDYSVNTVNVVSGDPEVMNITRNEHAFGLQSAKVGEVTIEVGYTNPQELVDQNIVDSLYGAYQFTITVTDDDNGAFDVKAKMITAKAKKTTKVKASKVFLVMNAKGTVTYKKLKGNKKITVAKNGNVTVKKGLKKGKKYTVKVAVTDSFSGHTLTKDVAFIVKVKK